MQKEDIYNNLINIVDKSRVYKDEPMSKHTSFKVGGNADFFVKLVKKEEIQNLIRYSKINSVPLYIIGNGSNLLVKDKGVRGIVASISIDNIEIEKQGEEVFIKVGSGVKLSFLAARLLREELSGFEFASGIPGTIGGAIYMNAGAHEKEIKDILVNTTYIDYAGNINKISNIENKFDYRKSIFQEIDGVIIEATLKLEYGKKEEIENTMQEYAQYRKEKQPITYPSAGSTFKRGNDYITAKLIDECGLKGYKIGGAQISELHAGFVINTGNATAEDLIKLVEYIKEKVYEKFKKQIELEIKIIGE